MFGQQLLQVRLDAVLHQTGIDAQFVAVSCSTSSMVIAVAHRPCFSTTHTGIGTVLGEPARWAHPVQGLVGPVVMCTLTDPSALMSSSRRAEGRWAIKPAR